VELLPWKTYIYIAEQSRAEQSGAEWLKPEQSRAQQSGAERRKRYPVGITTKQRISQRSGAQPVVSVPMGVRGGPVGGIGNGRKHQKKELK
jgi:hypothetical protein